MTDVSAMLTENERIECLLAKAAQSWTDAQTETGDEAETDLALFIEFIRRAGVALHATDPADVLNHLPLQTPITADDVGAKMKQSYLESAADLWKRAHLAKSPKLACNLLKAMVIKMEMAGLDPQNESDIFLLPTETPLTVWDFLVFKKQIHLEQAAVIIRESIKETGDAYDARWVLKLIMEAGVRHTHTLTGSWKQDSEKLIDLFTGSGVGLGLAPALAMYKKTEPKEYTM